MVEHNLELELERQLGRVAAPEELWRQIECPRVSRATGKGALRRWAPALACSILAAALLWQYTANRPRRPDVRSSDPARIRAWVKANAGLDLPLPDRPAQDVRLTGAHLVKAGVAELTFRVRNSDATLVVAKAVADPQAAGIHALEPGGWDRSAAAYSWSMGGQAYTLSCPEPGGLRAACQLCHS
jgi:hypothetical protein